MSGRILGIATRPRPAADMNESEWIQVEASGLAGENRKGQRRQVTLLAREDWERAQADAGAELHWTTRRANLLIEGLDLAHTTGRRIRVDTALLEVTAETDPCDLMDRFHAGLRKALAPDWRGGASTRVIEPGVIRVGDAVRFEDEAAPGR